jgi:hypothetical protein
MNNPTSMFRQCLLAIALAATALGAAADPIRYHVDLNTAGLESGSFLDFTFTKFGNAAPASATVSHLVYPAGALDETGFGEGNFAFNGDHSFSIGNGPGGLNYVDFSAQFGGWIGFDVAFDDSFLSAPGTDGSTFAVAVLDDGFNTVGGNFLAQFNLFSNGISSSGATGIATVTAVPEPSAILMMLSGLGLVGFMVRRRKAATA